MGDYIHFFGKGFWRIYFLTWEWKAREAGVLETKWNLPTSCLRKYKTVSLRLVAEIKPNSRRFLLPLFILSWLVYQRVIATEDGPHPGSPPPPPPPPPPLPPLLTSCHFIRELATGYSCCRPARGGVSFWYLLFWCRLLVFSRVVCPRQKTTDKQTKTRQTADRKVNLYPK